MDLLNIHSFKRSWSKAFALLECQLNTCRVGGSPSLCQLNTCRVGRSPSLVRVAEFQVVRGLCKSASHLGEVHLSPSGKYNDNEASRLIPILIPIVHFRDFRVRDPLQRLPSPRLTESETLHSTKETSYTHSSTYSSTHSCRYFSHSFISLSIIGIPVDTSLSTLLI